jgi:phosphinothricin acetyltransferase
MPITIVACTRAHAPEILEILNEAILNSTALYDYQPRTPAMMESWFDVKERGGYPVLGAIDDSGRLLGFATYGQFRPWPAYKYTVEHSIYIERDSRGRGIGRQLLTALIERARAADYHSLIGGIDAENVASIALHKQLGFELCGRVREAGFKFGRWLDLDFYQRILDTPTHPVDG